MSAANFKRYLFSNVQEEVLAVCHELPPNLCSVQTLNFCVFGSENTDHTISLNKSIFQPTGIGSHGAAVHGLEPDTKEASVSNLSLGSVGVEKGQEPVIASPMGFFFSCCQFTNCVISSALPLPTIWIEHGAKICHSVGLTGLGPTWGFWLVAEVAADAAGSVIGRSANTNCNISAINISLIILHYRVECTGDSMMQGDSRISVVMIRALEFSPYGQSEARHWYASTSQRSRFLHTTYIYLHFDARLSRPMLDASHMAENRTHGFWGEAVGRLGQACSQVAPEGPLRLVAPKVHPTFYILERSIPSSAFVDSASKGRVNSMGWDYPVVGAAAQRQDTQYKSSGIDKDRRVVGTGNHTGKRQSTGRELSQLIIERKGIGYGTDDVHSTNLRQRRELSPAASNRTKVRTECEKCGVIVEERHQVVCNTYEMYPLKRREAADYLLAY
ncbi:hypothetical protein ACRALDRAFT_2017325 [Sodiomyces alcalophilus JCM 7366]|uniref:uncharacterized protein n=1 Tax=Sodiomyces alcalophilus JCM 7366 TaxID=591952 RepID=UPI0039B4EAD2